MPLAFFPANQNCFSYSGSLLIPQHFWELLFCFTFVRNTDGLDLYYMYKSFFGNMAILIIFVVYPALGQVFSFLYVFFNLFYKNLYTFVFIVLMFVFGD